MNTSSSAFTFNEVLTASWAMTKKNWGSYLALGGLTILVYIAYGILYGILDAVLGLPQIVDSVLSAFLGVFVSIYTARAALAIARGEKWEAAKIMKVDGKTYLQALLAGILFYLVVMVGLVLLIVPGIIAAIMFCFYIYSIVDKNTDAVPALEDSMRMTQGNKGTIFLFNLALGLVAIAIVGIPAVILFLAAAGSGDFDSMSTGPVVLGGIAVMVVAVVVAVILGMMSMSGQAYMYLKMRAKTPLQIKK